MFHLELSCDESIAGRVEEQRAIADLSDIEWAIIEALHRVAVRGYGTLNVEPGAEAASAWSSNDMWTLEVKKALRDLGRKQGCVVYPVLSDESERPGGEWLFDLVWVNAPLKQDTKEPDWERTRGLRLACECEWDNAEHEILTDFFKLTFAFCGLRLFAYDANGPKGKQVVSRCRRACPPSRGFRYLLVGFSKAGKAELRVDAWTV